VVANSDRNDTERSPEIILDDTTVRLWLLADITALTSHVRSTPKPDIRAGFETTIEPAELPSPFLNTPQRIMLGNG
jgi:hypothetical protein